MLVKAGQDPESEDVYGQTPLHLAALRGNRDAAEYLVIEVRAYFDGSIYTRAVFLWRSSRAVWQRCGCCLPAVSVSGRATPRVLLVFVGAGEVEEVRRDRFVFPEVLCGPLWFYVCSARFRVMLSSRWAVGGCGEVVAVWSLLLLLTVVFVVVVVRFVSSTPCRTHALFGDERAVTLMCGAAVQNG